MKNRQLYEFRDTDGAGAPEVVMSRYKEGNDDLYSPTYDVIISSSTLGWDYDTATWPEDVTEDNIQDDDDKSYYILAANIIKQIKSLKPSNYRENHVQKFTRILIMFSDTAPTDVLMYHFKDNNIDFNNPDAIVTATDRDPQGRYRKILAAQDANDDTFIDSSDELIYRTLATSFASMKYSLP